MPETSKGNSECSFCRGEPITDNFMNMQWKFSLLEIEFFHCMVAELVIDSWVPWRGHFRIHYCPMCGETLGGQTYGV